MSAQRLSPLFTWRSAILRADLPSSAKLVAHVLGAFMNEAGESAFPSLATIADCCGGSGEHARNPRTSKQTVITALRLLEAEGYLHRTPGGGRGRSTLYSAVVPERVLLEHRLSAQATVAETSREGTPEPPTAALTSSENEALGPACADNERVQPQDRFPSSQGEVERVQLEHLKGLVTTRKGLATAPDHAITTPGPRQETRESKNHDSLVPSPDGAGERESAIESLRWALTAELGTRPLTRSEHGAWEHALRELADAGANAELIAECCDAYRDRWPDVALTPTALVRWWGFLVAIVEGVRAYRVERAALRAGRFRCPDCSARFDDEGEFYEHYQRCDGAVAAAPAAGEANAA